MSAAVVLHDRKLVSEYLDQQFQHVLSWAKATSAFGAFGSPKSSISKKTSDLPTY